MSSIRNELEYIQQCVQDDPEGLIHAAETRFSRIIEQTAQEILAHGARLILLAGPSASGKTTTARKLKAVLAEAGVTVRELSLDDFYHERATMPTLPDGTPDIESVHALDLSLLQNTLQAALQGETAPLPHYQFSIGCRTIRGELALNPGDCILLEGLHALHPELEAQFRDLDFLIFGIYISVASRIYNQKQEIILNRRSIRLARRITRDMRFRASDLRNTLRLWPGVVAGEETWLEPHKQRADVNINSIHLYEPCIWRNLLEQILQEFPLDDPEYVAGRRLLRGLRHFPVLSEKKISKNSLLREFMG